MHSHEKPIYQNISIKQLEKSEVEIVGEIMAEELDKARQDAIAELGKNLDFPGFRKGHIPEKILVGKIGEAAVLEEAAEMALSHAYPHIVIDHKIKIVGRPEITITKLAWGNPLGFKITVAVYPNISLPDYKKIAAEEMKKSDDLAVTEKDVETMLGEFARLKAGESSVDNTKEKVALPQIDDAFAVTLGADSLADLKNKLKNNLADEKKKRAKEKKRLSTADRIVSDIDATLPDVLVRNELAKMQAQFEEDLQRMGKITWKEYLVQIKKTDDEVKKEWMKDAEKRVLVQIILNSIADQEKINPSKEDVGGEVEHILKHNPTFDKERVTDYVSMMLTNEKVFQFLENQK